MRNSTVPPLLATLGAERAALQNGEFHLLPDLEDAKSTQIQALEGHQPTPENLHLIRTMLIENQRLFAAAIAGVKSARNRIDAMQNVRLGLNVYDRSGTMATVAMHQSAIEKKA